MCGLTGILYHAANRPVDPALLRGMVQAIAHRGPDAQGLWQAPGIGLGHRRLSIIDLAGGDQPLTNEDGSLQVVFNGEIYNHRELQRELESRGHHFRTSSDTEVLVHLYEEFGERLVERLRGMFAFALWDSRRQTLLLARDRVGLKPLYLYRDAEKLLFGSELKSLLVHPDVDRTLNPAALDSYLAWGCIPGEQAIFRRVSKLPPAHTLLLSAATWDAAPRRYWSIAAGERTDHSPARWSEAEWTEAVSAKLQETVQAHTLADVPVGAFLSGGLDSSAIVATLAEQGTPPAAVFTIGFNEEGRSEIPYAREVAQQFGCEHITEVVTPEAAASLDELVHHYDEPFADSSAIPTLLLSRLAAEHVKVVLSGDGGDEAFGGYARYVHDLSEAQWRKRIPGLIRTKLLGPLADLWPKADWLPRPLRAKTRLTNLSLSPAAAYANTLAICRPQQRRRLLASLRSALQTEAGMHASPELSLQSLYDLAPADDALAGMITADLQMLLPDDFLVKVDRASMAYGLEVRPPLVDHELLELVAGMPSEFKIRNGQSKWMLHKLFDNRLPSGVTRRNKQGFELPTDQWLRHELRDMFESLVLNSTGKVSDLIDRHEARRLFTQHLQGTGRHGNVLWSLLVLARWAEEYLAPTTQLSAPGNLTFNSHSGGL